MKETMGTIQQCLVILTILFISYAVGQVTESGDYRPTGKLDQFQGYFTPSTKVVNSRQRLWGSVWAAWTHWSFCIQRTQVRVRACQTIRGFRCYGVNKQYRRCSRNEQDALKQDKLTDYDVFDRWEEDRTIALGQLYGKNETPTTAPPTLPTFPPTKLPTFYVDWPPRPRDIERSEILSGSQEQKQTKLVHITGHFSQPVIEKSFVPPRPILPPTVTGNERFPFRSATGESGISPQREETKPKTEEEVGQHIPKEDAAPIDVSVEPELAAKTRDPIVPVKKPTKPKAKLLRFGDLEAAGFSSIPRGAQTIKIEGQTYLIILPTSIGPAPNNVLSSFVARHNRLKNAKIAPYTPLVPQTYQASAPAGNPKPPATSSYGAQPPTARASPPSSLTQPTAQVAYAKPPSYDSKRPATPLGYAASRPAAKPEPPGSSSYGAQPPTARASPPTASAQHPGFAPPGVRTPGVVPQPPGSTVTQPQTGYQKPVAPPSYSSSRPATQPKPPSSGYPVNPPRNAYAQPPVPSLPGPYGRALSNPATAPKPPAPAYPQPPTAYPSPAQQPATAPNPPSYGQPQKPTSNPQPPAPTGYSSPSTASKPAAPRPSYQPPNVGYAQPPTSQASPPTAVAQHPGLAPPGVRVPGISPQPPGFGPPAVQTGYNTQPAPPSTYTNQAAPQPPTSVYGQAQKPTAIAQPPATGYALPATVSKPSVAPQPPASGYVQPPLPPAYSKPAQRPAPKPQPPSVSYPAPAPVYPASAPAPYGSAARPTAVAKPPSTSYLPPAKAPAIRPTNTGYAKPPATQPSSRPPSVGYAQPPTAQAQPPTAVAPPGFTPQPPAVQTGYGKPPAPPSTYTNQAAPQPPTGYANKPATKPSYQPPSVGYAQPPTAVANPPTLGPQHPGFGPPGVRTPGVSPQPPAIQTGYGKPPATYPSPSPSYRAPSVGYAQPPTAVANPPTVGPQHPGFGPPGVRTPGVSPQPPAIQTGYGKPPATYPSPSPSYRAPSVGYAQPPTAVANPPSVGPQHPGFGPPGVRTPGISPQPPAIQTGYGKPPATYPSPSPSYRAPSVGYAQPPTAVANPPSVGPQHPGFGPPGVRTPGIQPQPPGTPTAVARPPGSQRGNRKVSSKEINADKPNVTGTWSSWTKWSECKCGRKSRVRSCNFPDSIINIGCTGISYELMSCIDFDCPRKVPEPIQTFVTKAPGSEHGFSHKIDPKTNRAIGFSRRSFKPSASTNAKLFELSTERELILQPLPQSRPVNASNPDNGVTPVQLVNTLSEQEELLSSAMGGLGEELAKVTRLRETVTAIAANLGRGSTNTKVKKPALSVPHFDNLGASFESRYRALSQWGKKRRV